MLNLNYKFNYTKIYPTTKYRKEDIKMQETVLREILNVVVDIKAEQKTMKQQLNEVIAEQKEMKEQQKEMQEQQTKMQETLNEVKIEQVIVKEKLTEVQRKQEIMRLQLRTLIAEQSDTKDIVGAVMHEIGEMN